jgi:hypothetical protein
MPYNEDLARRIRDEIGPMSGLTEKKMFGGVAFMLNGNMACGVHKQYLIARVGPEMFAGAMSRPHTRVFDISGKPMAGWVMVEDEGYALQADLKEWIRLSIDFAASLPLK